MAQTLVLGGKFRFLFQLALEIQFSLNVFYKYKTAYQGIQKRIITFFVLEILVKNKIR